MKQRAVCPCSRPIQSSLLAWIFRRHTCSFWNNSILLLLGSVDLAEMAFPLRDKARSYGAILKLIFRGRYALPKGHVSRLRCSFGVNL